MAYPSNASATKGGRNRTRGTGAKPKKSVPYVGGAKCEITDDAERRMRKYSEGSDDHCPVCLNRIQIFSVGRCNHPVCSGCSVRMRKLCDQKECPICRQDMEKVIHTLTRRRFEEVENNVYRMDRRYKICFQNDFVQESFNKHLEHRCPVCAIETGRVFATFKQLDQHVRREHELFYCDLCSDNLKMFSHEKKLYSRSDLALHRRKGDLDDSSHKGHPLCEYCQMRFMDKDELYRHLRKDHFFCHFCDADGLQVYYGNYSSLQQHFCKEHFLCEEGQCKNEQFTSAFRSEIDLKAHVYERHKNVLSKAAVRLNRTVDFDFTFTRPGANNQVTRRRGRGEDAADSSRGPLENGTVGALPDWSTENFPSLSQGDASLETKNFLGRDSSKNKSSGQMPTKQWVSGNGGLTAPCFLDEHFPTLGGGTQEAEFQNPPVVLNYQKGIQKKPSSKPLGKPPQEDYPSLTPTSNARLITSNFPSSESKVANGNPKGHIPPWHISNGGKPPPGMIPLTKSSRKTPAPMPDFLDEPSEVAVKTESSKVSVESKSSKNKKIKSKGKAQTVKMTNLASAADLISLESSSTKRPKEANGHEGSLQESEPTQNDKLKLAKTIRKKRSSDAELDTTDHEDFPGLVQSSRSISRHFARVDSPPGFGDKTKLKTGSSSMPPGFGSTTSREEAVVTDWKPEKSCVTSSRPCYIHPSDFGVRNSSLLTIIVGLIGEDSHEFNEFKTISSKFRKGTIGCREYHDQCIALFDMETFEMLLPELLVLLPDITKQQELYAVHVARYPKSILPVTTCARCGQMVIRDEYEVHFRQHLVTDFPKLSLA